MKNKIKTNIRAALRAYPRYQEDLAQLMPSNLIMRMQLIQIAVIVYGIEAAMYEADPEVLEYIRVKYFENSSKNIAQIAFELNISESTLKRWDSEFVSLVIRHINSNILG